LARRASRRGGEIEVERFLAEAKRCEDSFLGRAVEVPARLGGEIAAAKTGHDTGRFAEGAERVKPVTETNEDEDGMGQRSSLLDPCQTDDNCTVPGGTARGSPSTYRSGAIITDALVEAVKEARRQHKLAGNPIAEWRDGRVCWIAAEDIEVDPPERG
jgi:hypothetical protein